MAKARLLFSGRFGELYFHWPTFLLQLAVIGVLVWVETHEVTEAEALRNKARFGELLQTYWSKAAAVVAILVIGVVFFEVRRRWRRLYGSIEVLVGLAVGWEGVERLSEGLGAGLVLLGAVYIVVRGLDNYQQGQAQLAAQVNQVSDPAP